MKECDICHGAIPEGADTSGHTGVCAEVIRVAKDATADSLRTQLKAATEALRWYATSENYVHAIRRVNGKAEAGWRPVVLDAGERARKALATLDKEGTRENDDQGDH